MISPSGNEVGPFSAVEQASLTQLVPDRQRTGVFAWYNLVGSFATAFGALCGGVLVPGSARRRRARRSPATVWSSWVMGWSGWSDPAVHRFRRSALAIDLAGVKPAAPLGANPRWSGPGIGLRRSHKVVFRLAALFSLDAFAGGFVVQSLVAYWFHIRFGVEPGVLGSDLLRGQYPGGDLGALARPGSRSASV